MTSGSDIQFRKVLGFVFVFVFVFWQYMGHASCIAWMTGTQHCAQSLVEMGF
jgi:hypothetical protein